VASVTLWAKLVGARENVPSPVPPEELTEVFSADGAKVSETPLWFTVTGASGPPHGSGW
jgi:hypothetical protein